MSRGLDATCAAAADARFSLSVLVASFRDRRCEERVQTALCELHALAGGDGGASAVFDSGELSEASAEGSGPLSGGGGTSASGGGGGPLPESTRASSHGSSRRSGGGGGGGGGGVGAESSGGGGGAAGWAARRRRRRVTCS